MSLSEKIRNEFETHPRLRVLFLFDEEGTHQDEVESLALTDIRVQAQGGNDFFLKTALHGGEWAADRVFLYCRRRRPETQEELKGFALLDVLIANRELALNDEARFGQDYNLSKEEQRLVKPYMAELQKTAVQAALAPLLQGAETFDLPNLHRGLIGAFLKAPQPEPWSQLILRLLVLAAHAPDDLPKLRRRMAPLPGLEDALARALKRVFNEEIEPLEPEALKRLLQRVKYNALLPAVALPLPTDPYAPLHMQQGNVLLAFRQTFRQWLQTPRQGTALLRALEEDAPEVREEELLRLYGPHAPWQWLSPKMQWLLLREAITHIPDNLAEARRLPQLLRDNAAADTPIWQHALDMVHHTVACLQLMESAKTALLQSPEDCISHYRQSGFLIDQHYRKAITCRQQLESEALPYEVSMLPVTLALNDAYNHWLERSNRAWLQTVDAAGFDWSRIAVPKQWDFYEEEIADLDQKVTVIISDALRYEAAQELLERLHQDHANAAGISLRLAALPSKTSVGMSNLLPGKHRLFSADRITVDGRGTTASERLAVLQNARPESGVIPYKDLIAYNTKMRQDLRDFFKNKVTYIYHDTIDARGDSRKSEHQTFSAVEEAIRELALLVKKLHGELNVTKVFVTADHGFLYQELHLEDKDKEALPNVPEADLIQAHNRFLIYRREVKPEFGYGVPLRQVSAFEDADAWVVIPASINRYRRQGAGYQYVHGGASLQELLVPVIESGRKSTPVSSKVGVDISNPNPRIVSSALQVVLLQEHPVSRIHKERTVTVALYRGFEAVSNKERVTLNATAPQPSGRTFPVSLFLLPGKEIASEYQLRVFEEGDMLNPLLDIRVDNNTLIQPDF